MTPGGWLIALALLGAAPETEERPLLLVAAPTAEDPATLESEVAGYVRQVWGHYTDFDVQVAAGSNAYQELRACGGRFLCWLESTVLPKRSFVLLVTTRPGFDDVPDRGLLALMDVDLGRNTLRYVRGQAPTDTDRAQALVFEDSVRTKQFEGDVTAAAVWVSVLESWRLQLEPHWVQAGRFRPSGRVEVQGLPDDSFVLRLGREECRLGDCETLLSSVGAGSNRFSLTDLDGRFEDVSVDLQVQTATTTFWRPALSSRSAGSPAFKTGLRWSSVGVAMIGSVFIVDAIVRDASGTNRTLVCDTPGYCDEGLFLRLGPVLEAPLGYSLIGAAATWLVGSWLEGGDDEVPVWSLVAGVLIGATAYGVSTALQ